ncbi:hypothetical protein KUCAC02_016476 [Chaenocephalus aceratus]|nr:hypothetical protein KUCAC02_016476 [Chaenocephalus aceratus]
MEEAIAMTITSTIDDRIANSKYVGVIVDETTNITVEKMLITYLALQHKGEPETVFIGNVIPSGTAECITTKIKDVLSGRGVAMARVVGLGSDGANVMEEEADKNCPVAKGIRKRLQTLMFPALTHLLTDVLAVVNRMNLTFQKEDVNISSIQPVVNMTIASLEDLMNGPGEAETTFNEALHDGKFCGITLRPFHVCAQTTSRRLLNPSKKDFLRSM